VRQLAAGARFGYAVRVPVDLAGCCDQSVRESRYLERRRVAGERAEILSNGRHGNARCGQFARCRQSKRALIPCIP
jgi:hypothetical protein